MTKEQFITEFCRLADLSESFFYKHMHAAYSPELGWHVTEKPEEPMLNVKIKKLHPEASIPQYASSGAAAFDLSCVLGGYDHDNKWQPIHRHVHPGDAHVFDTGLAFEIPDGHVMLIFSRSGHGFKNDIRLSNCVGVIDSDYRGEVKVKLRSDEESLSYYAPSRQGAALRITHGDRIAQAIVLPIPRVQFTEVDDLDSTERGAGGFGSTGAGALPDICSKI